jgi:hypothetical protein
MEKTTIEAIAKVCHEANRAYCISVGDNSQLSWEDAAEWQRQSAIKGVEFSIANPDTPASAQHNAWLEDKRKDGWTYGPVKDPEKKQHPCFVPYEGLPLEQQLKDVLFKGIVQALTSHAKTAETSIGTVKRWRRDLDAILQEMKAHRDRAGHMIRTGPFMDELEARATARRTITDTIMWCGMTLKAIGTPNPYPNSKDPSNQIVDQTADGLKL